MVKWVQTSHSWDKQGHHGGFQVMVRHDGGPGWVMQWDRRLQWLPVNAQDQKGKKRMFLTQHLSPDEETEEDPWHLLGQGRVQTTINGQVGANQSQMGQAGTPMWLACDGEHDGGPAWVMEWDRRLQ